METGNRRVDDLNPKRGTYSKNMRNWTRNGLDD